MDNISLDPFRIKGLGAKVIAEPYQPSKDDNPNTWLATFTDPRRQLLSALDPWKE